MTLNVALLRGSWRSWMDSGSPRVGPYWLQWVWTLLLCAALAVGFTVLGFLAYARDAEGAWRKGLPLQRANVNAAVGSLLLSLVLSVLFHHRFAVRQRQAHAEKRPPKHSCGCCKGRSSLGNLASLTLQRLQPGTLVTLRLPLQMPSQPQPPSPLRAAE